MAKRIYIVKSKEPTEKPRLIWANSQMQAVHYVAQKYTAEVATQSELVKLIESGTKAEEIGNE